MLSNRFHLFKKNDILNMQDNFIFVDTETNEKIINNEMKEFTLKLGWAIFYCKTKNIKEYFFFKNVNDFWNFVFNKLNEYKHIIMFAHNTDFDFKILEGFNKLFVENDFKQKSFYIEGHTFIIECQKNDLKLSIWDTMNYIPLSLKKIGESIGFNKKEIDFNKCTFEQLKEYCRNDVEIIFKFVDNLLDFLIINDLSKLKPTVASLSFNIYRHKFYDKKNKPIYIHNWNKAIKLERESYKGGICDCFKIGEIKNNVYKLDINSMYPYIMKYKEMPTKLIFYGSNKKFKSEILKKELLNNIKENHIIANCRFFLPEKYAYILIRSKINKQIKSIFLKGIIISTLTTPEIDFVLKYVKLISVYELAIYKKEIIFDKFVDFFYNKRLEFKQKNNFSYSLFCKLILNSLYGKFGQTSMIYNKVNFNEVIENKKDVKKIILLKDETKHNLIQFGDKILEIEKEGNNSFDSFVAISSFVTSYARMYLIDLLLKAERENIYYTDTDSIFCNKKGINNLKEFINENK